MLVKVRLYATLQRVKAEVASGQTCEVELPNRSTVADLIAVLNIGTHEVKAIKVNDRARAAVYRLKENDEVDLFPPIGGG